MVHAIGDLVKSITIAVGAGFYPARAECTIKIARISAHSYHVAADFCIRDCLPPGGVEPRPYAYVVIPADSHWCIRICNTMPHNPFVTASPCHLPLHKGGFGAFHFASVHPNLWCCTAGRGKPLPYITTK